MIVLSITNCPPSLRGDLSKWLNEINTGVYIGKLSGRVREELWERICENIRDGQATMIYSAANAQGFNILVHNTSWKPTDYDGITLMKRPLRQDRQQVDQLKPGFSKASKYEKARKRQRNEKTARREETYNILDLETTGLDPESNRILEIGMLHIEGNEIVDSFHCFVKQDREIPPNIKDLTGITDEMVKEEGDEEGKAVTGLLKFAGSNLVVGYNVRFDIDFIEDACKRLGIESSLSKTKDVLSLARRNIEDIKNYKLETVAEYFGIEKEKQHRALEDCKLIFEIYGKLNEF